MGHYPESGLSLLYPSASFATCLRSLRMVSARDDNHAKCDWIPDRGTAASGMTLVEVSPGLGFLRLPPCFNVSVVKKP